MAQLYYSMSPGPSKDHSGPLTTANNTRRGRNVDACDLFQCGQCLILFTSLNEFISHKNASCQGEVEGVTYPQEGTSSDDSSSQLFCEGLNPDTESISLTDDVSCSLQLASNIYCDNQIYKDYVNHMDGELIDSSLKVTAFENVQVVSNGGLPVNLAVPGSIFSTDISNNIGEVILVNDNNNNESETICEPVSLKSNISDNKNLKCNYCSKVFTKVSNLKQHIRFHTGERPYHCILCGRKFTQISNARKHITSHKVWPEPWENTFESFIGNENPSSLKNLTLFSCRYCPLKFNTFTELKNHRKIHSSHKVFKCMLSECSEVFSDVDSLTVHLYNHSPATFRCSLCQLKFASFAKLSQHRISHSFQAVTRSTKYTECKVENLECPVCSKVLANMETLRRHLSTHLPQSHPCPAANCTKYFSSIRSAKAHYIHFHSPDSESVRHQCHVCSASFKRYDNLIRHRKSHKSTPQYKCPFVKAGCTKNFSRKDVLKKHLLIHNRKKNICKVCKEQLILKGSCYNSYFDLSCGCPELLKEEENFDLSDMKTFTDNMSEKDTEGEISSGDEVEEISELDLNSSFCSTETVTIIKVEPDFVEFSSEDTALNNIGAELPDINVDSDFDDILSGTDTNFNLNDQVNNFKNEDFRVASKDEKSFVIPREGIVSCDDENTIEIIVGIA